MNSKALKGSECKIRATVTQRIQHFPQIEFIRSYGFLHKQLSFPNTALTGFHL